MTIIRDREMYHGAALTQIADHDMFTSINSFDEIDAQSRSAYRVNDTDIGVFLKYSASPGDNPEYAEYMFTFSPENVDDIEILNRRCKKAFIVLVCYDQNRRDYSQICVLSHFQFSWFKAQGDPRDKELQGRQVGRVALYVRIRPNAPFRVWGYPEGGKRYWYYDVGKGAFPEKIFG